MVQLLICHLPLLLGIGHILREQVVYVRREQRGDRLLFKLNVEVVPLDWVPYPPLSRRKVKIAIYTVVASF